MPTGPQQPHWRAAPRCNSFGTSAKSHDVVLAIYLYTANMGLILRVAGVTRFVL